MYNTWFALTGHLNNLSSKVDPLIGLYARIEQCLSIACHYSSVLDAALPGSKFIGDMESKPSLTILAQALKKCLLHKDGDQELLEKLDHLINCRNKVVHCNPYILLEKMGVRIPEEIERHLPLDLLIYADSSKVQAFERLYREASEVYEKLRRRLHELIDR